MSADHPLDDHYSSNDSVESFSSAVGDSWSQSTAPERKKPTAHLLQESARGHTKFDLQVNIFFVFLPQNEKVSNHSS